MADVAALSPSVYERVAASPAQISDFCRRWQISELCLFGSILREDFATTSDVDVLVSFAPAAHPGLFDLVRMEEELAQLLGRKVDLITRHAVEQSDNWIRRNAILSTAIPFCASSVARWRVPSGEGGTKTRP